MSIDLSKTLQEWPYEPGQINVRLIEGEDGEAKIQMRLDLGILQLETSGRPDGQRPHGYESLLEYHEARFDHESEERSAGGPDGASQRSDEAADRAALEDAISEGATAGGESGGADEDGPAEAEVEPEFVLSEEDCRLLREEAVQYYHRYISLLVLGDYDGVVRDTGRNLRALDLCRDYAESEEDQQVLEQFRPYIVMMRTRALASQLVVENEPKAALFLIDEGLEQIRKLYQEAGRPGEFDEASEVQLLRGMRDELALKLPASQKSELRDRLRRAIEAENYELAAILRDELKMMKE